MLLRLRMLPVRLHVQIPLGRLHRSMPQVVAHHQQRHPRVQLVRRRRVPQPVRCCRPQQPGLLWIGTGHGRRCKQRRHDLVHRLARQRLALCVGSRVSTSLR